MDLLEEDAAVVMTNNVVERVANMNINDKKKVDDNSDSSNENNVIEGFSGGSPSLENQLETWRILKNPQPLPGTTPKQNIDLNGLETMIWLELEELIHKTGFQLPSEILILQPPQMADYLELDFSSADVATEYSATTSLPQLSKKYPAYRRQRRLSYVLPGILEGTEVDGPDKTSNDMRQIYLNIPSTKGRLEAILQRLELLNASIMAENELQTMLQQMDTNIEEDNIQGEFE